MRLVAYQGDARSTRIKIWGELGSSERVYVAGQEQEAAAEEAEEEIEVKVLTHSPQALRAWLDRVADRAETKMFENGREVGKREAYDRAWLVGIGVLVALSILDRLFA